MIINGPSYYQHKLLRRSAGQQEKFGFGSFLAFFSAKVFRGGPKALLQLTACSVALLLLMKLLLSHRLTDVSYSGWSWRNGKDDDAAQNSGLEDDESVPGGLRIVVFGDRDVATPARLQGRGSEDVEGQSWTELLCEELDCSCFLSFVPTSDDPSRVMTSTKLYATSVEQALNLTDESYGPGLDYEFMLDQFPIEWKVDDLSKQVDSFLSMKKPKHSPAETMWVFSFGMWDIWSLASEPLSVSKTIVDSMIDQIFHEVERLYTSALNETSIAWSDPDQPVQATSLVSTGLPMPTANPEKTRAWIKERDRMERQASTGELDGSAAKRSANETKHFRILIPRLFDPSLTPGWHSGRPEIPSVHSKAEQMRNAAVLTEKWNNKMYSALAEWIRTEQRKQRERELLELASRGDIETPEIQAKTPLEIFNERLRASSGRKGLGQPARAAFLGGHNHITSPQVRGNDVVADKKQEEHEVAAGNGSVVDTTPGPQPPQRDGFFYNLNNYLEEAIVERQLRNSGLRDARSTGKLSEEGFKEVWRPCTSEPSDESKREEADVIGSAEEADEGVEEGDAAYERKRSVEPAIRGRVPASAEPGSLAESPDARICENPDDHLFYTPFTVSPRAVAVVARLAADMVRRNETMRSGWASINLPPLKYVGG